MIVYDNIALREFPFCSQAQRVVDTLTDEELALVENKLIQKSYLIGMMREQLNGYFVNNVEEIENIIGRKID